MQEQPIWKRPVWASDRESTNKTDSAVIRQMSLQRETNKFLFYEDKSGDIWIVRRRNLKLKLKS